VVLLTLDDVELDVAFTVEELKVLEELRNVLVAERDDEEDKLVLLELELLDETPVVPFLI
jgi:hypothetical protein